MIRMRNIGAVFYKQILDTLKNLQILILFVIYPAVAFVMLQAMGSQAEMQAFFISTFAGMHCVFTPIVCTASILSDEKEKNTLKILTLSGVKPAEYLGSIGLFVILAVLLTGTSFLVIGDYSIAQSGSFLLLLFTGAMVSVVLGTCIGIYSKNMAAANATAVPVSMVFSFLPMLAFFNPSIEKAARYTYSYQIGLAIQKIGEPEGMSGEWILAAGVYLVLFLLLFSYLFHKKKWE